MGRKFQLERDDEFRALFRFRFQGTGDCHAREPGECLQERGTVSFFGGFDGKFGIDFFSLSPGDYAVGARNSVSGENVYSLELEIYPPEVSGADFGGRLLDNVTTVTGGGGGGSDPALEGLSGWSVEGGELNLRAQPSWEDPGFLSI